MFGDSDPGSTGNWIVDDNGVPANTLTLAVAGGAPTLTVNALGADAAARSRGVARRDGRPHQDRSGHAGARSREHADRRDQRQRRHAAPGPWLVAQHGDGNRECRRRRRRAPARQRRIDIDRPAWSRLGGGVTGLFTLDSGTATFGPVRTNSDFGSTFLVNGGTFFATDVNIRRNSAAAVDFNSGFIVNGGTAIGGHHRPRHQQLQRRAHGGRRIVDRDGRGHHRQPGHRRPRRRDARHRRHLHRLERHHPRP